MFRATRLTTPRYSVAPLPLFALTPDIGMRSPPLAQVPIPQAAALSMLCSGAAATFFFSLFFNCARRIISAVDYGSDNQSVIGRQHQQII